MNKLLGKWILASLYQFVYVESVKQVLCQILRFSICFITIHQASEKKKILGKVAMTQLNCVPWMSPPTDGFFFMITFLANLVKDFSFFVFL